MQRSYLSIGQGVLNCTRLNNQRLNAFQQLNLRFNQKINLCRLIICRPTGADILLYLSS